MWEFLSNLPAGFWLFAFVLFVIVGFFVIISNPTDEPTYTKPVSRAEFLLAQKKERESEREKHNKQFAPNTLRISPCTYRLGHFHVEEWWRIFSSDLFEWTNVKYIYKDRDGPLYKYEYPSRKEAEEAVFKILQDRADKEENQRKLRIFIANNPPKIYT